MATGSLGYDLYFGITNSKGETRIEHARVWDGQKIMAAQRAAGAAKEKEDQFTVSTATREDYLASRRGK